jgi:hypothetical protein
MLFGLPVCANDAETGAGECLSLCATSRSTRCCFNEFLKEHRKVEEQESAIAKQQKQIEALTAGLQKVSAQLAAASPSSGGLEATKPAPQVVENNR